MKPFVTEDEAHLLVTIDVVKSPTIKATQIQEIQDLSKLIMDTQMFEIDHLSQSIDEPVFMKVTNKIKSLMQIVDKQNMELMGRENPSEEKIPK